MAVNVKRNRRLRVSEASANGEDVHAGIDKRGHVGVPQRVKRDPRQSVSSNSTLWARSMATVSVGSAMLRRPRFVFGGFSLKPAREPVLTDG